MPLEVTCGSPNEEVNGFTREGWCFSSYRLNAVKIKPHCGTFRVILFLSLYSIINPTVIKALNVSKNIKFDSDWL